MTAARVRWLVLLAAVLLAPATMARAQDLPVDKIEKIPKAATTTAETPDRETQLAELRSAAIRLPLAAGLACILAMRPRRRGTPPRQPPVIQTQIILAIVGAVVMLVVGSSLARAFGIVGAAGLVRYRAKIEDPKDAGVMLSTLAVGLASGVGLWMIATFGTAFILLVLWIVESFEPTARKLFTLKVQAKDPPALQPKLERMLTSHHVKFELRGTSKEELHYEVKIPIDRKADRITDTIVALDPANATAAELEEKKVKT
ncbi:MAG TPA: DUF4956 domain-containing protein [Vicinamibacterales bacterium]|nr:DUF4956 domain-containing protein [Vicinamibacterales bacterium]